MKTCSKFFLFIALFFMHQSMNAQCDGIFLNEIHYDNIGSDVDEFIEVAVPVAISALNLANYEVTLYNGSNGAPYNTETLNNFVFGTTDGTYDYYSWNPSGGIQNGSPDGFGLSKQGTHCEFLSYEGSFTASAGPATLITSTDLGVNESNGSTMVGYSLQLIGGSGGTWQGPTSATKGAPNLLSCSITSVFITNAMCTGTDFTFEVNFSVVAGSGTYEVVDMTNGGTILASGSASPITVTIPNNSSATAFDVTIWDQAVNSCVGMSPATVTPQNCVSCTITGVSVSNDMCTGTDFTFDVAFASNNSSGTFEVVDVTNGNTILASGTTSPITVTLANNTSTTPFDIDVWDQNDNTCVSGNQVTVNPLDCANPPSCAGIFLNEIHYDDAGTDDDEFIEVAVDNSVSVALSTFTVSLYNGNGGVVYDSEIVSNFVMGIDDGTYTYYTWAPSGGIQNGPDGFSLSTGSLLCEFLSYEGDFAATNGPASGTTSTDIGVSENGNPEGLSLQLIGGVWTGPIGETTGDTNGGCNITGVSLASAKCVGADFIFEVAFSPSMGSGNYEVIDVTNGNAVLGTGTSSPILITISNNTSTTPFDVNVWDAANNTCIGTAITINPIDCSNIPSCDVMLNEIHYDNAGSDVGEFIEVAVDATTLVNLADYTVSLYNGSNGTVYNSETLDNFVVGNNDGTYQYLTWQVSGIQNGAPDGFALSNGLTLCEFLSYEGTFLATDGPAIGNSSTDLGVSEGSNAVGTSLQLIGGVWTGPITETPGDTNVPPTPCSITNVAVSNVGCVGADYVFEVSFDVLGGSGQYVVIDVTNGNAMLGGGSASPITVTIPNNTSTTAFDINVWDNNDNTCIGPTPVTVTPTDCSTPPLSCDGVFLNEIHYDNFGGDVNEFIEVAVENAVPVTLSDFTVSLYNGSAGSVYDMETLDNLTVGIDDGTYTYYTWNPAGLQNGAPDGFALTVSGMTCELLSYEGSFTATDGPANGSASTDLIVFEDGTDAPGLSLQLIAGEWVGPSTDTYGSTNKYCPISLNLTGTEIGVADYETSGDIISTQTINATAQVDYDAETSIILNPGFSTKLGAVFYAFIDGCNDGAGGINLTDDKPANSEDQ